MASGASRFTDCDKRFYPYLDKVLGQIPDDLGEEILTDQNLQIISDEDILVAKSRSFNFHQPVSYLIYLNTAILKQPVSEITFAIAKEFAGYLASKVSPTAEEQGKKLKRLLVEWEFIMDLDRIRPPDPIEESDGYQIGLEWARRQKLDDLLWNYKEYFDEWCEERISPERFEQLYIDVAPFSILEQMGKKAEGEEASSADTLEAEIIWGLMAAIKQFINGEA
ncbi:MAG: hypothetical protein JRF72_10360 [Deltaproteobacteria bacterium]|jgi:hypothetical protein|nr:hypothetical protein [Deltaproteobacteria bacterium]